MDPVPRRDYIGKRFCNAVHANWTKMSPSPSFLHRPVRRSATVHRGSPSAERTRRDRDRLSLLVNVTVGEVRVHKSGQPVRETKYNDFTKCLFLSLSHAPLRCLPLSFFLVARTIMEVHYTSVRSASLHAYLPMCADTTVPLRNIQSMCPTRGWEG